MSSKYRTMADVEARAVQRLLLGEELEFLDKLFGNGVDLGLRAQGAYIFTGGPNAGKSTLLLQMLGHFAAQEHRVAYLASDQDERDLRGLKARLSFKSQNFIIDLLDQEEQDPAADMMARYNAAMSRLNREERRDYVEQFIITQRRELGLNGPHLIVGLDSVNSIAGSAKECEVFAEKLKKLCQLFDATVIGLGESKKDDDWAGTQKMIHNFTGHWHFDVVRNEKDAQIRQISTNKNRGGTAGSVYTNLKSTGHVYLEAPDTQADLTAGKRKLAEASALLASVTRK